MIRNNDSAKKGTSLKWGSVIFFLFLFLISCDNNPYGEFPENKVMFTTLSGDPRTLDPVRVSDTVSNSIASNLHDTPYEYHYLKRPLQLVPSMATEMPVYATEMFRGKKVHTFQFSIQKGLRYQDDECFSGGRGREIRIDDIIFSMKRAADPGENAFGYPLLTGHLLGFDEFSEGIKKIRIEKAEAGDLEESVRQYLKQDLPGIVRVNDYTLKLRLVDAYPQVIYFFSLSVGAPVPAECFYYYDGQKHNGSRRPTYDRHPVASGPYLLDEWHSNYRMVLKKNPAYRKTDRYPHSGEEEDANIGLLENAGVELPIVDEFRFQIIKAGPTIWTLFDQGYLDRAGIPREVFDQVIVDQGLSERYIERGVRLDTAVDVSTYWWYFNMKDPVVGSNRRLRQAISLAVDREELIARFLNDRGVVAHSIIPPGIEGYTKDFKNPYSAYDLKKAKRLLAEAGYPGGVDPKTGKPLHLTLTLVASQGATTMYRYYIDQLSRINVNLEIEQLDWPTVLEKKMNKSFQMIHGGWHADYPDPQNFMQLFYGPNVASTYNENHYRNSEFDTLYRRMRSMPPGPDRESIIRKMNEIVARDAHVVFLYHPVSYGLSHQWVSPLKPHPINTNQLKYRDLDPEKRRELSQAWNRVPFWGYGILFGGLLLFILLMVHGVRQYRNMEYR